MNFKGFYGIIVGSLLHLSESLIVISEKCELTMAYYPVYVSASYRKNLGNLCKSVVCPSKNTLLLE